MIAAGPQFLGWVSDLARQHTRALSRIARAEGLSPDDALDAVQEAFQTFLALPEARTLVGQEQDSRRLLSTIVRNAARNMRRRHHRARPHSDISSEELAEDLPSVDSLLAAAEEHIRLMGCVNRLGEIQRHIVSMRMLEELGSAEVAASLKLSAAHVAVLLHRAKKDLNLCMAP